MAIAYLMYMQHTGAMMHAEWHSGAGERNTEHSGEQQHSTVIARGHGNASSQAGWQAGERWHSRQFTPIHANSRQFTPIHALTGWLRQHYSIE